MASGPSILRHIHLPSLTPYLHASHIQETLVRTLLDSKSSSSAVPPPPPTILTAQFPPTYTTGRRDLHTVTPSQIASLTSTTPPATFHRSLRGGQTTFHGPGQLIAYPIIDLRRHKITPRAYIRLLETSTIATCSAFGVKDTTTTENPGVWTSDTEEGRKIAAVGVHLRRNVTSHGIGLNVSTDMWWFDRIVACGLPERKATSLKVEGVMGVGVEEVGRTWVEIFTKGLEGQDGMRFEVERVSGATIEGLLEDAVNAMDTTM